MPLYECVRAHKHDMALLLLERGADPTARLRGRHATVRGLRPARLQMIALLERHGGAPNPSMAGLYRRKDLALRLLAAHGNEPLPMTALARALWPSNSCCRAKGGDVEIALALQRVDWPKGDRRGTAL